MLIYEGTKQDFIIGVENDTIFPEIRDIIYEKMHRNTPDNEFRAWVNSLTNMYIVDP